MLLHGLVALTAALSASPRVLVVGGSGRVGSSTARWLHRLQPDLQIAVGGRSQGSFEEARSRLPTNCEFTHVDLDGGVAALTEALSGGRFSLIVHTAGPFQQRTDPALMRAAISAGVPYCDVCDELALARNAKALTAQAAAAGIPCVVSCGIWPGVSALMAAEAVDKLGGHGSCDRLEFSFFTAGTGGAGPTIVSATFLLLATEVAMYVDGELVEKEPWLDRRVSDFGEGVGSHECFTLDNPDVPTTAEALGIKTCVSRFGTFPSFWNGLFGAMKLLPRSLLMDKAKMQGLAVFSMPIIRVVDALVGGTNAMRVDAFAADGTKVTVRCAHKDLEDCVGQATAAFGLELMRGRCDNASRGERGDDPSVPAGVHFPAELGPTARANILRVAREKAFVWEL
jgi:saccharopine dehydrogenase-like NADP-dependent oxidoreductase